MTTKRELLKMVRLFCSECMGGPRSGEKIWPIGNPGDIDKCSAIECIWWEYRDARDPYPNPAKQSQGRKLAKNLQQVL
jgi:hypothetical protein